MPVLRLGIVQINVVDLAAAREFYVGTLGFRPGRSFPGGGPFELANPGGPTVLVYQASRRVDHDYPAQTGTTLVFYTDDIDGTVERWRAAGVEFVRIAWSEEESGIAYSPYGRFIAFRDPSGNVHELLQPAAATVV